jgi:hypothetical protein
VSKLIRKIKAIYTASDDPDFGTVEDEVIVLTPDIVLEKYDDTDGLFFITKEPIAENQETINIDRATCPRFEIDFVQPVDKVDYEQLTQLTFLEFIRTFASAPERRI